jgi:bifunctional N-acetylglucosamine-1-phosphate-uridyltransferase/glucosamine-1-phosphate-acetyltransferase GlmU-like protein
MAKKNSYYYYRIYDDKEQFNYIRSTFQEKKIRAMLKKYEKSHQEYYNTDFVNFLKKEDPKVEIIEVTPISY